MQDSRSIIIYGVLPNLGGGRDPTKKSASFLLFIKRGGAHVPSHYARVPPYRVVHGVLEHVSVHAALCCTRGLGHRSGKMIEAS